MRPSTPSHKAVKRLLNLVVTLALASVAWGYTFITNSSTGQPIKWPAGTIPIKIMADNSIALSDGSTKATTIQAAMLDATRGWNNFLGTVQFTAQIQPPGVGGVDHNYINEIFFSSSPYNYGWDSNTLAVTTGWSSGNQRTEADIIFNTAFTWDSYRGASRATSSSGPYDIQRVALHELGHVLGLDHPDQAGQSVIAIMNSVISDIDSLQPDDITGAQSLYGAPLSLPSITGQPGNQTIYVGQNTQFAVSASGNPSPTYQWQRLPAGSGTWANLNDAGAYSGTGSGTLSISSPTAAMNGDQFRCVATNSIGSATSSSATLSVYTATTPSFTTQPTSQTVLVGSSVTFAAAATGFPVPTYQWTKGGVTINGATGSSYTIASVDVGDAGNYAVVATNVAGSVNSNLATLTVNAPPVITSLSPTRQVLNPGQSLHLSVGTTDAGVISYQWVHNGYSIIGANGPTMTKPNLVLSDGGWYVVLVSNSFGTRRSAPIFIAVSPAVTQVTAWGNSAYGVPTGLINAVAISGWLVLKADGTVVDLSSGTYGASPMPVGLTNVVSVSANGHAMVLKADGTVIAWGNDFYGETIVPAGLTNVVAIAAGNYHSLALKSDGTVVAWGESFNGVANVPVGLSGVVAIAAGDSYSLALKADGTVVAWGYDQSGDTLVPAGLNNVISISAGEDHSLALKSDFTVAAWGYDFDGDCSVMTKLTNATAIAAGRYVSLALESNGSVVGAGDNSYGDMNIPPALSNVIAIVGNGGGRMIALRDASGDTMPAITTQPADQTVIEGQNTSFTIVANGGTAPLSYQWRKDGVNISGATSPTLTLADVLPSQAGQYDIVVSDYLGTTTSAPVALTVTKIAIITSISPTRQVLNPGQPLNLSVSASGTGTLSFQWVHNGLPINGATASTFSLPSLSARDGGYYLVNITDDIGIRHSAPFFVIVAPPSGKIVIWGSNYGITIDPGLTDVVAISRTTALKADGTVVSLNGSSIPTGLNNIVAISALLAVKADGTVVQFVSSTVGSIPTGLNNVVAVADGYYFQAALKADGTVVAWGPNVGSISNFAAGLRNIIAIACDGDVLLTLNSDGAVVGWGVNEGLLGIPAGLTNVSAIARSWSNSFALDANGNVVVWGWLGPPWLTNLPSGLIRVTAIAAEYGHALALNVDGTVVAWGTNDFGESNVPTGFAGVFGIAADRDISIALYSSVPIAPAGAIITITVE